MKPQKSIEYSEMSWNPFTGDKTDDGKCEIVNRYGKMACWACSMAYRLKGRAGYSSEDPFQPTFHPDKLDIPLKRKKPTIYATCFMSDISYCKPEWWAEILGVIRECNWHTFLMLTKQPEKFVFCSLPDNLWFGTTVNLQSEIERIDHLIAIDAKYHWVSFEPPFEHIDCSLEGIDGIAIGALTGKHPFQPINTSVFDLVEEARKCRTKIVIKDNLKHIVTRYREWP